MRQEQIQPKAQLGKVVLVQLFGVIGTELVRGGDTANHGEFVCVDEGPCAGECGVGRIAVQGPDEGDDEGVVRPPVDQYDGMAGTWTVL